MRAVPTKGLLTCPRAIPPGGTPPKGQRSRAHSASVNNAARAGTRARPRGASMQATAKIADSRTTRAA